MPWEDFLKLIADPDGIALIVGFALSFLVEYIPAYNELLPKWKRLVMFGICEAVALAGAGLAIATGLHETVSWAGVWWPAIVAGILAFASSTVAHTRKL